MLSTGRTMFRALGVALVAATSLAGHAGAHDGHQHGGAQHGGAEAKTERHHFEAVFTRAGVTLYAHGADHQAVDVARLAATATFYHPNAPETPWFSRELKPKAASPGQPPDSLGLAIDLSKAPEQGAQVAFRVTGLADPAEAEASFVVPLTFAGELAVTKATAADQQAIAAMKLCPVSGEDLGSMGGALKVSRGGKSTFICCKGCLEPIKASPEKFLGATAATPAAGTGHDHAHHDH